MAHKSRKGYLGATERGSIHNHNIYICVDCEYTEHNYIPHSCFIFFHYIRVDLNTSQSVTLLHNCLICNAYLAYIQCNLWLWSRALYTQRSNGWASDQPSRTRCYRFTAAYDDCFHYRMIFILMFKSISNISIDKMKKRTVKRSHLKPFRSQ